jgi:hypothetical protein
LKAALFSVFKTFTDNAKKSSNPINIVEEIKILLSNWRGLFSRFVPNEKVQLQAIAVIEEICIEIPDLTDAFHVIIMIMNSELNAIGDEILKNWAEAEESVYSTSEEDKVIPEEFHKKFVEKMKKYIEQEI